MTEQPNPATGRPTPVVKHLSEGEAWARQFLHEKWLGDRIDALVRARRQGFEEGLAEARAKLRARGEPEVQPEWEAEVREESLAERLAWLIPALVAGGVPAEDVAAYLGVDVEEVARLIAAKNSAHPTTGDVIDEAPESARRPTGSVVNAVAPTPCVSSRQS